MNEARQVIMPRAKTGDTDSEDESDEDDSDEEGDEDSEDNEKVDVKGRHNRSKMIKKKDKFVEKFKRNDKSNGKNKDKHWIMKKKDR